jgi:methionyl-tRNA formyltransferase
MADPLRIVFMGSPDFAVPSLEALCAGPHRPVAVVTGPDKRRGRGNTLSPTPVKECALRHGIPVIETDSLKDPAIHAELSALRPDLFVVVAFKILPKALLEVPAIGSVNVHASLLPKYRGAAPIHWAIVNGETETGVTIFFLNEGVDTGGILLQATTPIGPDETTGDVYYRLMRVGAETLMVAVENIWKGGYTLNPQSEAHASPAPKVFPDDALLPLDLPAEQIRQRIRGFNPAPGAWVWLDGKKLRVHESKIIRKSEYERADRFQFMTPTDVIRFTVVQLEGKAKQPADEFIRGYAGKWVFEGKKQYI